MLIPFGVFSAAGGGGGAAAGAYELIESTVLGTTATSVTFNTSGLSAYNHLEIRYTARTNQAAANDDLLSLRFNSDTGSNYSHHQLVGNGSSVSSGSSANSSYIYAGLIPGAASTANAFGVGVLSILDFGNTSKYKTTRSLSGKQESTNQVALRSGNWRSTSAITAIELYVWLGGSLIAGSRFSLYGIKG